MAFVNRGSSAERHEDRQAAGEPIDFDPTDPSVVKVHYDLAAWDFEQRAELAQALAEESIPHAWDGDELVVPEEVESATDALFERLEAELGPFPVALVDGDESVEYRLDEWSDTDRDLLRDALVDAEVPHRWEADTVVVAVDAEDAVDDLLDAIESGQLVSTDDTVEHAADGVLSDLFLLAKRLARSSEDAKARRRLIELEPTIDPERPPYAFPPRTWVDAVTAVSKLIELFDDEAAGRDGDDPSTDGDDTTSAVGRTARQVHDLLRPYV